MQHDSDHAEIRRLAYEIWLKEGQPDGRDREHWEAAKAAWAIQRQGFHDAEALAPEKADRTRTRKPRPKRVPL